MQRVDGEQYVSKYNYGEFRNNKPRLPVSSVSRVSGYIQLLPGAWNNPAMR